MKPAPFDFVRASSIADATRLLDASNGSNRVIAGAQSLGPMLNLRLAQPRLLIDITGIPELTRIENDRDAITIGACVTTANIEDGRLPGDGLEVLANIASGIAYRAVRNRGTIGGSLCHADPSADWLTAFSALGAECIVRGTQRQRMLPLEQLVTGAYQTALAEDEILEAVRLPRLSKKGRLGFVKICRKVGEFALAMAAVRIDPERGPIAVCHRGNEWLPNCHCRRSTKWRRWEIEPSSSLQAVRPARNHRSRRSSPAICSAFTRI